MGTKHHVYIILFISMFTLFSGCMHNDDEQKHDFQTPTEEVTPTVTEVPDGITYGKAAVEEIHIMILESFPVQIHVAARGYLPDGCTTIDRIDQTMESNTFVVSIITKRPADALCTQAIVPFDEVIPLDVSGLEAGEYIVIVNGIRSSFVLETDNIIPD